MSIRDRSPMRSRTHRGFTRRRAGQTAAEFAIVAGILLSTVVLFSVFLYTYRGHTNRVINLAAADFP
jgi:Flp pilus assembly protein TadG